MTLNPEVIKGIEDITGDRTHGARWLTGQALSVMKLAIEKSRAETKSLFLEEVIETGRQLARSRPSMASITGMAGRLVYYILREAEREVDLAVLKERSITGADEIIRGSEDGFRKATMYAAGMIDNGDILMTCSYSSTICQAFRIASLRGNNFRILAVESIFDGRSYGEALAQELKSYEIEAEVIPDGAIKDRMPGVNKVLVGADSLMADGSLVNGVPTMALALAAMERDVPFYVLCETAKFDARSYLGQQVELEDGFDGVPSSLITGIISEAGMVKPREIMDYIQEISKYFRVFEG